MSETEPRPSGMLRAAMCVAFSQELRRLDVGPDADVSEFGKAIKDALDDYGVQPGEISSEFGVTRATISRWRSGDATPGVYMRRQVVDWLADRVEAAIGDNVERQSILRLVDSASA